MRRKTGSVLMLLFLGASLSGCITFRDAGPCYGYGCGMGAPTQPPPAAVAKVPAAVNPAVASNANTSRHLTVGK
ncbi:MAG: hypothetical protein ACRD5R_16270 [Candidatus Acidiferrales bacterium]